MSYVHFDRAAVAASMREAADAKFELALATNPTAAVRQYLQCQMRFVPVMSETLALCIDLKNEGMSADYVAQVLGAVLPSLVGNLIWNTEDPSGNWTCFQNSFLRSMEAVFAGTDNGLFRDGSCAVKGEQGGRA